MNGISDSIDISKKININNIGNLNGKALFFKGEWLQGIPIMVEVYDKTFIGDPNLEHFLDAHYITSIEFIRCNFKATIVLGSHRGENNSKTYINFDSKTSIRELRISNFRTDVKYRDRLSFSKTRIGKLYIGEAGGAIEQTEFKNFRCNQLVVNAHPITIIGSELGLVILEENANLRERFKLVDTKVIYPKSFLSSFFGYNDEVYANKIPLILSSISFISQLDATESSMGELERIYAFFETRNSPIKKFFYFLNDYHYSMLKPALLGIIAFLAFEKVLSDSDLMFENPKLNESIIFIPQDMVKEFLFFDFHFSFQLFYKVVLFILAVVIDYSLFSFALALKRRFGYRKPFS